MSQFVRRAIDLQLQTEAMRRSQSYAKISNHKINE